MVAVGHEGTEEQQETSGGIAVVFSINYLKKFVEAKVQVNEDGRLILITLQVGNGTMQLAAVYGCTGGHDLASRARTWVGVRRHALPQES